MKRLKTLIILLVIVIASGCGTKEFSKTYKKMEVGENKINGYNLDLRIYGKANGKAVNEIVKIKNYMNEAYEIMIPNKEIPKEEEILEEEIIYIIDNDIYIRDEAGNYNITSEKVKYSNPAIYLEGLKNIKESSKSTEEKIGEIKYKVYEVVIKKDVIQTMMNDTNIENVKVDKDMNGKVYINEEGYVYRIIYYVNDLIINANYFGVNKVREINVPKSEMGN